MSSLVVEGAVGGAGRVAAPGQALVPQVHGVAVVQQRLGHLRSAGVFIPDLILNMHDKRHDKQFKVHRNRTSIGILSRY